MTSSRLLVRNTVLNVAAQVIPMLAAVIAIPLLIRHLGAPRFGVLTLAWAAIGYFGLFDFGLGRALTQAVAARLGMPGSDRDLPPLVWTALSLMLVLGALGGVLLAALAPLIVHRGLNVPSELVSESVVSFYLLAASLPFVVTAAGLRGLLEAHQHFGAATALRVPLAVLTFASPLAVLPFSSSLVPVVAVLVGVRCLTWLAHVVVCARRYDYLRHGVVIRRAVIAPLIRLGGWMTVSNVVSPLMAYVDRFFIGAILPLVAVAYYVTPFEVVTKLLVLPIAMIGAFFPAFASTAAGNRARTARLFHQAVRAIVLLMFPLLFAVTLFAREGLTAWVGADVARESAPVLRWLAAGVFVNALAQAPFAVLQGVGRPDLTAKLHLLELPVYGVALWWLTHRLGIVGVAMAWTLRVTLDTLLLLALALREAPSTPNDVRRTLGSAAMALGAIAAAALLQGEAVKVIVFVAAMGAFGVLGWTRVVAPSERASLRAWARPRATGATR